jgi:hypothetical protein
MSLAALIAACLPLATVAILLLPAPLTFGAAVVLAALWCRHLEAHADEE